MRLSKGGDPFQGRTPSLYVGPKSTQKFSLQVSYPRLSFYPRGGLEYSVSTHILLLTQPGKFSPVSFFGMTWVPS